MKSFIESHGESPPRPPASFRAYLSRNWEQEWDDEGALQNWLPLHHPEPYLHREHGAACARRPLYNALQVRKSKTPPPGQGKG